MFWDSKNNKIINFSPEPYGEGYSHWWRIDCTCCAGVKWGGETSEECHDCDGCGYICLHEPTGTVAKYPGGKLLGARYSKDEVTRILNNAAAVGTAANQLPGSAACSI